MLKLQQSQNPIGTLVGTAAIAAKCEDVSLSRSATEQIPGVIERVTFHNDKSGVWMLRKNGRELGQSLKLLFRQC